MPGGQRSLSEGMVSVTGGTWHAGISAVIQPEDDPKAPESGVALRARKGRGLSRTLAADWPDTAGLE